MPSQRFTMDTSRTSQGRTSSRAYSRRYDSFGIPSVSNARIQRSYRKCSLQPSKRTPDRHAVWSTRPMRRSPRESAHSISASRGSCHFIFAPRTLRNRSLRYAELALERLDAVEGRPLEGRPGLRHERADRNVDLLAAVLAPLREDAFDERDELVEVGRRLGRQADHRVDLDEVPAAPERDVGGGDHVGVGERLVDDAAQAVGARLRREREAGLAHLGDRVGQADREGLGPQRRQGDRHAPVGELRREALHERLDLRIVGRREGEEPDLAPARLGDELLRHRRRRRPDRARARAGTSSPPGRSGIPACSRA